MMPPLYPCGLAVDMLRSGYTSTFTWYQGRSDLKSRVAWVRVPRDTAFVPYPTTFCSQNWDDVHPGIESAVGEVSEGRVWSGYGTPITAPGPDAPCGNAALWLSGAPDPAPLMPSAVPVAWVPACCRCPSITAVSSWFITYDGLIEAAYHLPHGGVPLSLVAPLTWSFGPTVPTGSMVVLVAYPDRGVCEVVISRPGPVSPFTDVYRQLLTGVSTCNGDPSVIPWIAGHFHTDGPGSFVTLAPRVSVMNLTFVPQSQVQVFGLQVAGFTLAPLLNGCESGDTLLLLMTVNPTPATPGGSPVGSITDTAGNVWARDILLTFDLGNAIIEVWRAVAGATVPSLTITVNLTGHAYVDALPVVINGLAVAGNPNAQTSDQGNSTAPDGGAITTTSSQAVMFSLVYPFSFAADVATPPPGFRPLGQERDSNNFACWLGAWQLLDAPVAGFNPAWSLSNARQWAGVNVVYTV